MGLFDIKPPKKDKRKGIKHFGLSPVKSNFKLKPMSLVAKPRKPKMKNLIFGYDHPKPARKVKGKLAMNWTQAKKKFPKMSPLGDADRDGVKNFMDCKPFDKKRQGMTHQYSFASVSSKRIKTVKMKPHTFLKETYKEIKAGTTPGGDLKMGFMTFKGAGAPTKFETYVEQVKRTPSNKGETEKTAVAAIKKKILSKKENVPIPFLDYNDGKPTGHEGRHTALAMEELGIKTMPVTVEVKLDEKIPKTYNLPQHRKKSIEQLYNETGDHAEYDKEAGRYGKFKEAPELLKKHGKEKFYHGTSSLHSTPILREGIKSSKEMPWMEGGQSDKTDTKKTYVFKEPHHAQNWAKVVATQGFGHAEPVVIEADIDPLELTPDYNMKFGESYSKSGPISKEDVREFKGDVSYPDEKPVKVKLDLDNEVDEPFEITNVKKEKKEDLEAKEERKMIRERSKAMALEKYKYETGDHEEGDQGVEYYKYTKGLPNNYEWANEPDEPYTDINKDNIQEGDLDLDDEDEEVVELDEEDEEDKE